MPDPVSWKVVERGWAVYDREGEQVGTVHEIAGDSEHDIFDGFAITTWSMTSSTASPSRRAGSA